MIRFFTRLLYAIFVIVIAISAHGQNLVVYTPTGTTGSVAANASAGNFTRGSGIASGSSCSGNWYQGTDYATSSTTYTAAESANEYWEFTISPNAGYELNLTQVSISGLRASGTGPANQIWAYRVGTGSWVYQSVATASGTGNCSSGGNTNTWNFTDFSSSSTVTFRLIPYGATNTSGTHRLGTVTLNGTVALAPSSTRYWDVSAAAGLGGSAVWGTTFSTSSAGNTALTTANSTNDIIYAGTAGTVTLGANQAGSSHTFNVNGYTIATNGSGGKTLSGAIGLGTNNITFSPVAGADLTIPDVISGNGSASSVILTKTGAGTLILNANNSFTGKVSVTNGFLQGTGEAGFGANPASFTADQITLNGGGIRNTAGSNVGFSSNRGITLGSSGGTFEVTAGNVITLGNIVAGTGGLTKTGPGTLRLDVNSGSHTYTGPTTIAAGTLQLERDNNIDDASNMILAGGTFTTARSSDGSGRAETVGTLRLTANSTIHLGTGNHDLRFSNSSAVGWIAGQTLTITGWAGNYGAGTSGTAGRIFVGNNASGLTGGQLGQIQFYDGSIYFGATILSTGEIIPLAVPVISTGSVTAFGNQCVNTASAEKSYVVSGAHLTDNITITPPSGYEISLTSGSGFSSSPIVLNQVGGNVSNTTVYVRFLPGSAISYPGNIVHTSSGANNENVAVSGTGIDSAPSVSTTTVSGFTATTATSGGTAITGGCGAVNAKGIVWGTSANPTVSAHLGITNDGAGTANYGGTITGLTVNTTYHYRAYVTNSHGQTNYGSNQSFTFAPEIQLQQPAGTNVACGASYDYGTVTAGSNNDLVVRIQNLGNAQLSVSSLAVSGTGFSISSAPATPFTIAANGNQDITIRFSPGSGGSFGGSVTIHNNDANEGACTFNLSGSATAPCDELFISEYVEGSGNNKYIEIFNPTGSTISLNNYSLRLYANGSSSPNNNVALSGSIPAYGTVVYRNSSATLYGGTTIVNAAVNFNGDDAVALAKNGVNIDIFGNIGNDPGSSWSLGGNSTVDQTLRRKFSVTNGINTNPGGTGSGAFVTLSSEWDQFAQDVVSGLGSHASACLPTCTSPDRLEFTVQPSHVQQGAAMAAVQVRAYCSSDGTTASSYTGAVTLSVLQPGCGYTSQTVNAVNGVATFSSVTFLRSPQNNLRLAASASGLAADTSATFNVTSPAGTPVHTTLRDENFSTPAIAWNYSIGTPSVVGSGGSAGTDVTGVKVFSGNSVLAKSYSANNSSGEQGSLNTVTFDNVSGLSAYDYVTFTFKVASLGSGSGAGTDSDEDLMLDISTDNGTSWTTVLTQRGANNRLFGLVSSPVTALSALSNTTYAGGSTLSAFTLQLNNVNNFSFRIRANNNRNNENWVLDDIRLVGTSIPPASAFNLPAADAGTAIDICNGTDAQLSVNVSSFAAPLSYSWSPSASLNDSTVSNPIASLSGNQLYTVTVTDAHNCSSTSQVQVMVHGVGGTAGLWTGNGDRNWFNCFNWDNGLIPDSTVNVSVPVTGNNPEINQSGAVANSLDISNGAWVEINDSSSVFTLFGSLVNNGSLLHTEGLFVLRGNAGADISGNQPTFYNLQINKADTVVLQVPVQVANRLILDHAFIKTGTNVLELGQSALQTGKLTYHQGHVMGIMKRWFNGTGLGDSLGLFPLGNGVHDRFVKVEYTQSPSAGGSLTAEFKNVGMGLAGIPITVTDGTCTPFDINSTADEGYWQMDDGDGLSGGMYDISLVGEGFSSVTDLCQLSALKRVGLGNWTESGIHVDPTGTLARPVVKREGASGWSNWGFGGGPVNPLPVELLSFTGTCVGDGVVLYWSTASEINSERFVVERSEDMQQFEYITELDAAGNSNEIRHYKATLPRADKTSYYRLRQEDYDGAFEYFGPISVSCQAQSDWKVYTDNYQLYILAEAVKPGAYTVNIIDMNGKGIFAENIHFGTKSVQQNIDIGTLGAGMYIVAIRSAEEVKTFRIMLTN